MKTKSTVMTSENSMKTLKTCEEGRPSVKQACIFLSDYAAWLLGCGATCIRIEKNVRRMADAWHLEAAMTIMPAHIHLTVWDESHEDSYTNSEKARYCGISFNINTQLSKLSWAVADGKSNYETACRTLAQVISTPPTNRWGVLTGAALANASFCRLFGGDAISMLIVCCCTLAGYRLKQIMLEDHADIRLVFFCSAFFSAVIGSAGFIFGWGNTPDIALGTSVLYLIPGIPYINSVSDMLDGHYICSFSRFMNAAVLTACLSAGLCGGLLILNLKWF